jgi:carbonic anhydrase/acetyltransferase-like protein (isoleucine patch superfamily)
LQTVFDIHAIDTEESGEFSMPVYRLENHSPSLPEAGRYFIASDAHVMGNVTLGEDVGIWFGSVLRGDNEPIVIGARSNVQEGSMFHTDPGHPVTIGEGCTIGHHAIIHGCTVGDNTLVGMGAVVLNGAKIGNNCLVGAGALVTEGKEFPDNSLIVGSPARLVRELDENAVASLAKSADIYVANYRRFLAGLERID